MSHAAPLKICYTFRFQRLNFKQTKLAQNDDTLIDERNINVEIVAACEQLDVHLLFFAQRARTVPVAHCMVAIQSPRVEVGRHIPKQLFELRSIAAARAEFELGYVEVHLSFMLLRVPRARQQPHGW